MDPEESQHRLEVCQGPDCFGAGGGATLLEIEELVQEATETNSKAQITRVVRGGCRNFCSMGPNVHWRVHHHTKVSNTTACQKLILGNYSLPPTPMPVATKLMLRKADRQRWKALRLLSRIQTCPAKVATKQLDTAKNELHEALKIEENAVRNCQTDVIERVQRRKDRLLATYDRIAEENAELSDESDEEDIGKNSR